LSELQSLEIATPGLPGLWFLCWPASSSEKSQKKEKRINFKNFIVSGIKCHVLPKIEDFMILDT